MKIAVINEFAISEILTDPSEEKLTELGRTAQTYLDVTDMLPFPEVGWAFDGVKIVIPEGYTVPALITKLAFLNRFTDTELATIESFAASAHPFAPVMKANLRKQSVATFVDLKRIDTITGVQNLVALTLITAPRANTILTAPVQDIEKYIPGA